MPRRDDWFRNEQWSPDIEANFNRKLARTRGQGPQYLCIQANILAQSRPSVSLQLLDLYFATGDKFFRAGAFEAQAIAYEALSQFEDAVASYRNALRWEESHRCMITGSHLSLPYLIASRQLRTYFDFALDVLFSPYYEPAKPGERRPHYILMFPSSVFLHSCALALIYDALGNTPKAVELASRALAAAAITASPFPRHPGVGLVTDRYTSQLKNLRRIARSI
jgi:tetratricopeptide (TPR) repeat protein